MGPGVSIIEATISEAQNGMRLDKALAELVPDLSRERLKALIVDGQVTTSGLSSTPSMKVAAGQAFAITLPLRSRPGQWRRTFPSPSSMKMPT